VGPHQLRLSINDEIHGQSDFPHHVLLPELLQPQLHRHMMCIGSSDLLPIRYLAFHVTAFHRMAGSVQQFLKRLASGVTTMTACS
jgi:hypothetical protein